MDLVAIARLRRSRGNRGEVIADSLTSVPERFQRLSRVFLRRGAGTAAETVETAQVEGVWLFRDEPVFKFAGVDSINAAELLAGAELCGGLAIDAPKQDVMPPRFAARTRARHR